MNVTYSDTIKAGSADFSLLQHATALLEKIRGRSSVQVKAEWDRKTDERGRVVYSLRLFDSTDEVSAVFTPAELRSSDLHFWLNHLWGDFLQVKSHRLLEVLLSGSAEGE